jgi:acetyl-CoA carboxylase biotin carboxyl carrier protein
MENGLTDIDASPETIQRLVELIEEHSLTEIEVEQDGLLIRVKGLETAAGPAVPQSSPFSPGVASTLTRSRAHLLPVLAPMVGSFYRSPSPEDPPYAEIGDRIAVGQTVGVIEAMKVFSEIPSEVAGRIVEIVVDNRQVVELGQPLMYVDPQ